MDISDSLHIPSGDNGCVFILFCVYACLSQDLAMRSAEILALLEPLSLPWFAEFFKATMLQVALSSAQETDEDVLTLKVS